MTLAEFLRARIDEDEVYTGDPCPNHDRGEMGEAGRTLAECEAKRQIVDAHSSDVLTEPDEPEVRTDCRDCWQSWPCYTLRTLAMPYAAHPDYREEWNP